MKIERETLTSVVIPFIIGILTIVTVLVVNVVVIIIIIVAISDSDNHSAFIGTIVILRRSNVDIDLTAEAFDAFLAGRALIAEAGGALDDTQLAELRAFRDTAVGAWEKAIAATVVHYINDTLADMASFGTDDYDFLDHANLFC